MSSFKKFLTKYKFIIINCFLFLYFIINFFDGNRGYIALQDKKKEYGELINLEKKLILTNIKFKQENEALTTKIDKDLIDELYRKNFVVGKKKERLLIIK